MMVLSVVASRERLTFVAAVEPVAAAVRLQKNARTHSSCMDSKPTAHVLTVLRLLPPGSPAGAEDEATSEAVSLPSCWFWASRLLLLACGADGRRG
ncbi:hypothetical protein IWZ00DRAFT_252800 [Phyllosticta capitalensis]|uniref:Secreted protein n=1 Tax=Phyllosticta capitalensis TaxID=121624 RepID=A0ABR1YVK8_9PEZI